MSDVTFRVDGPTLCVGHRPPARRRLFKLGLVALATAVVMSHVAPPVSQAINTALGHAVTQIETHRAETRLGMSAAQRTSPFAQVLMNEDAWREGRFEDAGQGWLRAARQSGRSQDLTLVGWSVRAAIQSGNRKLLEQTVSAWNDVVPRLPADLAAKPIRLTPSTTGHDVFVQVAAMGPPSDEPVTETDWLARESSGVERASDMHMCGTSLGCETETALSWADMNAAAAARVKGWQNRGFSPQEAWDLYREQQLVGDANHEVSSRHHQELSPPERLRLVMREHLSKVNTPFDLGRYWKLWPEEAARLGVNLASEQQMGVLGGLSSREVDWEIRKEKGQPGWDHPVGMPAMAWQRLRSVMVYQLSHMPVGPVPAGLTEAQANKRLLQAVQQGGLSQLRWPSVFPDTPVTKWRLATMIEGANQHLEHTTGWSGPVLGHAGHTLLDLAASPGGQELGFQTPVSARARTVILASVIDRDSLGALAHEWTHANDYFVGQAASPTAPAWASEQAVQAIGGPVQALWGMAHANDEVKRPGLQLWEALTSPNMGRSQRRLCAIEGWVERWTALRPEHRAHWLSMAAQWDADLPITSVDSASEARPLAELAQASVTSAQTPRFRSSQTDLSSSAWVQASLADSAEGYWGSAPELVARSFEAQMRTDRLLSTRDQVAWIYYPQGVEKAWQGQAWKAYFHDNAGWWNHWRQQNATRLSARADVHAPTSRRGSLSPWGPAPR